MVNKVGRYLALFNFDIKIFPAKEVGVAESGKRHRQFINYLTRKSFILVIILRRDLMADKVPGKAWVVVFAGTAVNLCLGILYAWSVWSGTLIQ